MLKFDELFFEAITVGKLTSEDQSALEAISEEFKVGRITEAINKMNALIKNTKNKGLKDKITFIGHILGGGQKVGDIERARAKIDSMLE